LTGLARGRPRARFRRKGSVWAVGYPCGKTARSVTRQILHSPCWRCGWWRCEYDLRHSSGL